jgi:hypothetical protein
MGISSNLDPVKIESITLADKSLEGKQNARVKSAKSDEVQQLTASHELRISEKCWRFTVLIEAEGDCNSPSIC